MADEAILRIVIVDEGRSSSQPGPIPAETSHATPSHATEAPVSEVVRNLRTTVDTLTTDISRASAAFREASGAAKSSGAAESTLLERMRAKRAQQGTQLTPEQATAYVPPAPPPPPLLAPRGPEGTPYERLLKSRESGGIQPEEFNALFADIGLTDQERKTLELTYNQGKKYKDVAKELGVHKSRMSPIATSISKKMELPEPLTEILKQQATKGKGFLAQEQVDAGALIESAREPGQKRHVSRVPDSQKLINKFTSLWAQEFDVKEPNQAALNEIKAVLEALQQGGIEPGVLKSARQSVSAKDIPGAMKSILGVKHLADGGEITNVDAGYVYQNDSMPNEEKRHWPRWEGLHESMQNFILNDEDTDPLYKAVPGSWMEESDFDMPPMASIIEDPTSLSNVIPYSRVNMSRGGTMPNSGRAASGQDWHPAWLTDKEYVVNAKSAERNREALQQANANPNVTLSAKHYAVGGQIPMAANVAGNAASAAGYTGAGAALSAIAPILQAVVLLGQIATKAAVDTVKSIGEVTQAIADADANPSQIFKRGGTNLTESGENRMSPLLLVVGETTKQFGILMDAIQATSQRYGEYSPDIAVAQAMVEVQHTMGELRRAQESGPELARYLRAQGDLQQRVEDIKVRMLTKLLPLVTMIVSIAEKVMPAGEGIAGAIGVLAAPLQLIVMALDKLGMLQEDANRPVIGDPTETLFNQTGVTVQPGVAIPRV